MVKIETPRLIIRDHIEQDIDSLHLLLSDEKAMYYIPDLKTTTLDESKENLYEAIKESKLENRRKYFFAITMKETKDYIGEVGFTITIDCPQGKVATLGYFILEKYWGKGIATEATKAVIDYGFFHVGIIKFEVGCVKNNAPSENIMKKLGMIKEAEYKKHVYMHGNICDRVEYRLLKTEWESIIKEKNI